MCSLNRKESSHYHYCSLSSDSAENFNQLSVTIGVILNRETSVRKVDKGPSADDTAGIQKFQKFWGDKAELRRFKDGTILDCVVWGGNVAGIGSKRVPRGEEITEEIVRYILKTHMPFNCNIDGGKVVAIANQLQGILPTGIVDDDNGNEQKWPYPSARYDAVTMFRKAVESVDSLRGILTSKLQGMPLVIESLSAATPLLRYSSYFPPVAHPIIDGSKTALNAYAGVTLSRIVSPLKIIATLQKSSKWPSDLVAIRNIKCAMLLRLSNILLETYQVCAWV